MKRRKSRLSSRLVSIFLQPFLVLQRGEPAETKVVVFITEVSFVVNHITSLVMFQSLGILVEVPSIERGQRLLKLINDACPIFVLYATKLLDLLIVGMIFGQKYENIKILTLPASRPKQSRQTNDGARKLDHRLHSLVAPYCSPPDYV